MVNDNLINITDFHICDVDIDDSILMEKDILNKYLNDFTNLIQNISSNSSNNENLSDKSLTDDTNVKIRGKITHIIFDYNITDFALKIFLILIFML